MRVLHVKLALGGQHEKKSLYSDPAMCDNGDFFDDGIGVELEIFLGISEELSEEERAKLLEKYNEPLNPDEMLETPFDYLDEEEL